jgi:tRNA dimethylallyltransferase
MAIRLAGHFNTKIISADSRQCYKELNIGVAKPTDEQLAAVHHYFVNSHSIFEDVNAAAFEDYALAAVDDIFKTNDYAIMVGGTGLYIKAFCEGMDEIPAIPVPIRNEVIAEYEKFGLSWLQQEVKRTDPEYFETGEIHNPQRLMRALEVKRATGSSIISFHSSTKKNRPFSIVKAGLELPREQLYHQINERVEEMMQKGLLAEVHGLLPYADLNALQTVGYKELTACLRGATSLDEAVTAIKSNTRHYAKRQMTWFKKDSAVQWFHPDDFSGLISYLDPRKST